MCELSRRRALKRDHAAEAAVTYDAQKNAFVEVAAPGTKTGRKKIAVKLGVGNGTKIQILDGLKAGDKVVLPS